MPIKRCPSSTCRRPFQINQFGPKFSTSRERGKITCPHCGLELFGDSGSIFLTHALSAAEEAEFNANHSVEKNVG